MSQQQGNDLAAPEPLANTEPDKFAQATIEDKLNASNYISSDEIIEITDAFEEGDGLAWRFNPQFVKELRGAIITETTNTLLKLKEEMTMHTVPEGKDLITRSYLNNSIDFMVAALQKEQA